MSTFNGNTTFGRDFVGRHLGLGRLPVPRRVDHVALLSHLPMLGRVQVQQVLFGRLREHVAHTAPVQLGIVEHVAVGTIRLLHRLCIATLTKQKNTTSDREERDYTPIQCNHSEKNSRQNFWFWSWKFGELCWLSFVNSIPPKHFDSKFCQMF